MKNKDIDRIRSFNRFYTNHIGLINQYIYHSHYSLPEVRVLFELYHHKSLTAKEITELVSMDKGLLSRMLRTFEKRALIKRETSKEDARATNILLTPLGRREYEVLDKEANDQIDNILRSLSRKDRQKLIDSMNTIKKILSH
ncbi:MAG TPA: MarR family winged helix-turn-helix transcriptional regulator [Cyclobacteriaceae bacterium]|nr:MarR family winged helix-turn-helix transcriptional regulator [Cyclobacteriaceae bacterium]